MSPLLLLLFVNDLPDTYEALTLLFADDQPATQNDLQRFLFTAWGNGTCRSILSSTITPNLGEMSLLFFTNGFGIPFPLSSY